MSPKRLKYILHTICQSYPQSQTELVYDTPFQLLLAVILSAQSTDRQVNKVTKDLFVSIQSPQDIVDLGLSGLDQAICSIGLHHHKSNYIYKLAILLCSASYQDRHAVLCQTPQALALWHHYGYIIPDTIAELIKLPGVGIKTAKVVGAILYQLPVLAVDTHVHRVANRLGMVQTHYPAQTDKILAQTIPSDLIHRCHHSMVLRGRYRCKAIKPLCADCPLQDVCPYYHSKHS